MQQPILVLNAGSSSLKFSIFGGADGLSVQLGGAVENIGHDSRLLVNDTQSRTVLDHPVRAPDHAAAIAVLHDWFATHVGHERGFAAAGHRVVHGGSTYAEPVRIDDAVIAQLQALVPLAPLHQPHHLAAIQAQRDNAPQMPQVACFDTSFHSSQAWVARTFALPRQYEAEGLRRYGFHGLSYEYIVSELQRRAPERAGSKLIVAHLGNGASLCAIEQGRSVATTMGLTPLDGLPMSTRSGALDPGVLLYLMREHQMDADAIEDLLYRHSGLLGVSGASGDVRELLALSTDAAHQALALFAYRISREIGSLAAALQGLDTLVFTGGIGEHQSAIRAAVCDTLGWLGVKPDQNRNARGAELISADDSRVQVRVIPTDENLVVARHTLRVLQR